MSIRLEIDGGAVIEIEDETITLGSDPSCTVSLPSHQGVAAKHAVIRKIAGRWIVEAREGDSVQVGDAAPTRMHWLNRGDVIHLVDRGPTITFETDRAPTKRATPRSNPALPTTGSRPVLKSSATPPESDTLQLSKPKTVTVPPLEDIVELEEVTPKATTKKARSSASIKTEEFKSAPAPAPPPLPPLTNSNSWLVDSTSAAANARQRRARQRFWLQMAGVGALGIVALAIWKLGSGGSSIPEIPVDKPVPVAIVDSPKAVIDTNQGASKPTPNDATTTITATKPSEGSTATPNPTPVVPTPPKSTGKGPSATLVAVRDGVYAVFARHSDHEHAFRLGTAWVASRRSLVTSGAVATAVEELQRDGLIIEVSQPFQDQPVVIKGARVHPAYRHAAERAASARARLADAAASKPRDDEEPADVELARAMANQARFDLGVLDIEMGQRLTSALKVQTGDLPDVTKTEFLLVGFPFVGDNYQAKSSSITDDARERVCPRGSATKVDSNLMLTMAFTEDVADHNWSGSPVFDRNQRVIGVYSRPAKLPEGNEKSKKQRHAVIWLGRLPEFASELE